jgi:hypothetical protein
MIVLPLPECPNQMSVDFATAEGLKDNLPKTFVAKTKNLA